jgi:glycosyltransferase involved in cell wall biosynthesis
VPNKDDFRSTGLYDQIRARCNGDMSYGDSRVMFILDYLTDPQMETLFSIADYYVSATHCEGFNRPLLQAMSFGTVPVSTANTAMADYIDADNAIVIAEKPYPGVIARMAGDVAGVPYAVPVATRFDVARACRAAIEQKPDEYERMAARAAQTVLRKFSAPTILRAAEARLAALRAPAHV